MTSKDSKELDSKVVVIRMNGSSTEMKADMKRVFKRQINLNFEPSGMIIRQIHCNSLFSTGIVIHQTITNEEIGVICGAQITSPSTFIKFNNKFVNGVYDFVLMDTYTSESNVLPSINTTFESEIILVVEFVKFK